MTDRCHQGVMQLSLVEDLRKQRRRRCPRLNNDFLPPPPEQSFHCRLSLLWAINEHVTQRETVDTGHQFGSVVLSQNNVVDDCRIYDILKVLFFHLYDSYLHLHQAS